MNFRPRSFAENASQMEERNSHLGMVEINPGMFFLLLLRLHSKNLPVAIIFSKIRQQNDWIKIFKFIFQ